VSSFFVELVLSNKGCIQFLLQNSWYFKLSDKSLSFLHDFPRRCLPVFEGHCASQLEGPLLVLQFVQLLLSERLRHHPLLRQHIKHCVRVVGERPFCRGYVLVNGIFFVSFPGRDYS